MPRGLIAGHNLDLLLRRLTIHAYRDRNFDRMKIPFRAVATDLDSGNAVVIDSGDFAAALRASMSLPGIFRPVEMQGKQLIDGGIANNLPVDVVRADGCRHRYRGRHLHTSRGQRPDQLPVRR